MPAPRQGGRAAARARLRRCTRARTGALHASAAAAAPLHLPGAPPRLGAALKQGRAQGSLAGPLEHGKLLGAISHCAQAATER